MRYLGSSLLLGSDMNSRRPPTPLLLLGILAMIALFAASALLPAFVVAVLLMVVVLAAFAVLALYQGRAG
jgi:hypothetical protein